jgi:chemotaxis methyl-accepting protein methylase
MSRTSTDTILGRYFPLYESLEREVMSCRQNFYRALVIGPGYVPGNDIGTYQAFEIANIMQLNAKDFSIDVADISDYVLQAHTRHPWIIVDEGIKEQLSALYGRNPEKYFRNLFAGFQKPYADGFQISIPQVISSRINPMKLDLVKDSFRGFYDLIVCTGVINYYPIERENIAAKIDNALFKNGYFLGSGIFDNKYEEIGHLKDGANKIKLYKKTISALKPQDSWAQSSQP